MNQFPARGAPAAQQNANSTSDAAAVWKEGAAWRRQWPTARDLFRLVRRNAIFAVTIAALTAATLVESFGTVDEFSSTVSVRVDPRDSGGPGHAEGPHFGQIADDFRRIVDDRNLLFVLTALPVATFATDRDDDGPLHKLLRRLSAAVTPIAKESDVDAQRRRIAEEVQRLKRHVAFAVDEKSETLTLSVASSDPAWSQRLASLLVERFMQRQVHAEIERVTFLYDSYRQFLTSAHRQSQLEPAKKVVNHGRATDSGEIERLQVRERELLEQIDARRDADLRAKATHQRLNELEAELAKLKTTLNTSHPDVIAKVDELRAVSTTLPVGRPLRILQDELADLQTQLNQVGAEPTVEARPKVPEGTDERALSAISLKAHQLFVERMMLERQLASSNVNFLFKVTDPPTFDPAPQTTKATGLWHALLAAVLVALVLAAIREGLNAKASDGWRLANHTGLPIFGDISARVLTNFPGITPQSLVRMREAAAADGSTKGAAAGTMAEYRKISLSVRAACQGRRIFFVTIGNGRHAADFFYSFFNLHACDQEAPTVVIDCNHLDPVVTPQVGTSGTGDLCLLLSGKANWGETRIAHTPDKAFDLLPPPPEMTVENMRAFRARAVEKLFDALAKPYQCILIRSLRMQYLTENAVLAAAATDIVLVVDAGFAAKRAVDDARRELGPTKVRGIIMLNS